MANYKLKSQLVGLCEGAMLMSVAAMSNHGTPSLVGTANL